MKTIHQKVLVVALISLLTLTSYAQKGYSSITYSLSFPSSKTSDYIDEASWRGGGFETGYFLGKHVSVGIATSWNVFNKNLGQSTLNAGNNTDVSGNTYRYINAVPVFVTSHYYFGKTDGFNTYVGVGVGTIYRKQETDIGEVSFVNRGWQWGLFPEVGVNIPLSYGVKALVNARYNYGFKTGLVGDTSYLNVNVGLSFSH
ncbi:OmpW family outer membrane protein [Spirosoma arcticum]